MNPVGCVSPKPLQASTIALDDQNGQTIGFRGMQLLPTIRMALGELYVSDYSKDTCIPRGSDEERSHAQRSKPENRPFLNRRKSISKNR